MRPIKTLALVATAALAAALAGCDSARPLAGAETTASACVSCHGDATRDADPLVQAAPPATARGGSAGAHLAHLRPGRFRAALACGECHVVPTSSSHSDGVVQVPFPGGLARTGAASPSWNGATCSGVYCHGATLAGGPATTPAWTSVGLVSCGSCHGTPPTNHATSSTNCNSCHPGTVDASGSLDLVSGLHLNGVIDVQNVHPTSWAQPDQHGRAVNANGLSTCKSCHGGDLGGGSAGVSCSSCHASQGFPAWDTTCTFCHGDRAANRPSPPLDTQGRSLTTNVSVGVHAAHVTTTITTPLACTECHPARGQSVITDAAHVDGDGIAEVTFGALARTGGAAAAYARASPTSATCNSVYCHGEFLGGSGSDPTWTSTTQATCVSCHGAPPARGKHDTHSGYACAECHGHAGSGATHVNGAKDVPFSSAAPGAAWNPTGRSCGSFSCHGESHSSGRTW